MDNNSNPDTIPISRRSFFKLALASLGAGLGLSKLKPVERVLAAESPPNVQTITAADFVGNIVSKDTPEWDFTVTVLQKYLEVGKTDPDNLDLNEIPIFVTGLGGGTIYDAVRKHIFDRSCQEKGKKGEHTGPHGNKAQETFDYIYKNPVENVEAITKAVVTLSTAAGCVVGIVMVSELFPQKPIITLLNIPQNLEAMIASNKEIGTSYRLDSWDQFIKAIGANQSHNVNEIKDSVQIRACIEMFKKVLDIKLPGPPGEACPEPGPPSVVPEAVPNEAPDKNPLPEINPANEIKDILRNPVPLALSALTLGLLSFMNKRSAGLKNNTSEPA